MFHTDEFAAWYESLSIDDADSVAVSVDRLEQMGLSLPYPYSSAIAGSRYAMRELRVTAGRSPLRVFYAFDPHRDAVLLIGGDKSGDNKFYDRVVPQAENIWEAYLDEMKLR